MTVAQLAFHIRVVVAHATLSKSLTSLASGSVILLQLIETGWRERIDFFATNALDIAAAIGERKGNFEPTY